MGYTAIWFLNPLTGCASCDSLERNIQSSSAISGRERKLMASGGDRLRRIIETLEESGFVYRVDEAGVRDEKSKIISSLFIRLRDTGVALKALSHPSNSEAAAALTGHALELLIDIAVVRDEADGTAAIKREAFIELNKFRAAHRILGFCDDSGDGRGVDAGGQREYMEKSGGIEETRRKVIEVWGPDNGGRPSYPVHWSGRKCSRVIAHEMGPDMEELYIRAYPLANWYLNDGADAGGRLSEQRAERALESILDAACSVISRAVQIVAEALDIPSPI